MKVTDIPETILVPEHITFHTLKIDDSYHLYYNEHFYDYSQYELDRYKAFWEKMIGDLYPDANKEVLITVEKHKYWQELNIALASDSIADYIFSITKMILLYATKHVSIIKGITSVNDIMPKLSEVLQEVMIGLLKNPYFDSESLNRVKKENSITMILPENFNFSVYKENDKYYFKYEEALFNLTEKEMQLTKNAISQIFDLNEEMKANATLNISGNGKTQTAEIKAQTRDITIYLYSMVGELLSNAILHKYRETAEINKAEQISIVRYIVDYIQQFNNVSRIFENSMVTIDSNKAHE